MQAGTETGRDEGRGSGVRPAIYQGDIYGLERDSLELAMLGVELGPYSRRHRCFTGCLVGEDALRRLRGMGCKYLWDLTPVAESARSEALASG